MAIDINIESQVSQTITDGVTNKAPSENAVFDALALKLGGAVSIGQVAFGTVNGVGGDSGLFWDNVNKRLGIGTSTPTARLHVQSQGALSTDIAFRVRNSADTVDIIRAQGDGSVFVGQGAGNVNTGANNSFFGIDAGRNNTTGNNNSANGYQALFNNTTGGSNTAYGFYALRNNTTGNNNSANGLQALLNNATGGNNTANGVNALLNNTTGNNNSAFGIESLRNNTTGSSNTAYGYQALFNNTTGNNNSANGSGAGRFIADGTTANSITNSSVFLGASTRAQDNNQTNQIVIGFGAIGNGSNTATLGNTSIIDTVLRGRVNLTQYATGSRPTYVKGALIYDSTLGKLLVGGNSGWEVVTSI
jgi:hypothetical protein